MREMFKSDSVLMLKLQTATPNPRFRDVSASRVRHNGNGAAGPAHYFDHKIKKGWSNQQKASYKIQASKLLLSTAINDRPGIHTDCVPPRSALHRGVYFKRSASKRKNNDKTYRNHQSLPKYSSSSKKGRKRQQFSRSEWREQEPKHALLLI